MFQSCKKILNSNDLLFQPQPYTYLWVPLRSCFKAEGPTSETLTGVKKRWLGKEGGEAERSGKEEV
jgi:hypothetical protein